VSNALANRVAYIRLPSLYNRAYALVYETGESGIFENVLAPDEGTSTTVGVKIFNG